MTYNNNTEHTNQEKPEFESIAIEPEPTPADDVTLLCLNDLEMKPVVWMWEERIACAKLNVLAGDAGLGKSQTTANFAAIVSTGGYFPDSDTPAIKGNVIFLSAEDDPADTIKPRLVAAGADVNHVYILDAIKTKSREGKEGIRNFDLSEDIERLAAIMDKVGNVRLVVIDPISAYMGGTDSHNNADMRGLLAPLSAMAAKHGAAVLLVTHLNKSQNPDIMARVMGSIALVAAARAGFVVVKDTKEPDTRYFLPIKNNIGNDREGFAYHIETVVLSDEITTSKIVWHEGAVDAHKILHPEPEVKPTATTAASAFLHTLLAEKPMLASDIFEEAIGGGYSKAAMQRAANRLKVHRKKCGMQGGWYWSLSEFGDFTPPEAPTAESVEDTEDFIDLSAASSEAEAQPS
jgi:hypothetical protein